MPGIVKLLGFRVNYLSVAGGSPFMPAGFRRIRGKNPSKSPFAKGDFKWPPLKKGVGDFFTNKIDSLGTKFGFRFMLAISARTCSGRERRL
jgi:hypothetical protein